MRKIPPRDARAMQRRKAIATRRVGAGAQCKCGETRPRALISSSNPITCSACDRNAKKMSSMDGHHIAGHNNSPITMSIPVNDHQAHFNTAQDDWPNETVENPDRSPLRSAAAHLRGFVDTVLYLIEKFVLWVADLLEHLDTFLEQKLGPKWWKGTILESFEPKRK